MSNKPRKIIVKAMTINNSPGEVFDFFENVKNWESGGVMRAITKDEGEWWKFKTPAGEGRVRLRSNRDMMTMDHDIEAGGVTWDVHSRIIPNARGSSMTWTFVCPENMSEEQFKGQLKDSFESEMIGWRKSLEEIQENKE